MGKKNGKKKQVDPSILGFQYANAPATAKSTPPRDFVPRLQRPQQSEREAMDDLCSLMSTFIANKTARCKSCGREVAIKPNDLEMIRAAAKIAHQQMNPIPEMHPWEIGCSRCPL